MTGRNQQGQFTTGNKAALGHANPQAAAVQELRQAMLSTVTEDDIKAIIAKQIELAKSGSIPAAQLILDRVFGKPRPQEHEIQEDMVFTLTLPPGMENL